MYRNTPAVLWLGGRGGRALYRNTMRNRPTIRQPVGCNTFRVRAGRWARVRARRAGRERQAGASGAGARRQQARAAATRAGTRGRRQRARGWADGR